MERDGETPSVPRWKRELVIASGAFAFGFFALPIGVYWVGQKVVGEYSEAGGLWSLTEHIWADLLGLDPAAWILVLSPMVVVELLRILRRIVKTPKQ